MIESVNTIPQSIAPPPPVTPKTESPKVASVGRYAIQVAQTVGSMGVLCGQLVARCTPSRIDKAELRRALYKTAIKSLPIVLVTALATGALMVVQSAPLVLRYNAQGLIAWGTSFGTLREMAPLLTALMVSGRVGANNTAELGTMIVTEQIDGLRALAIDPLGFLVVPRFLAIIFTTVTMTIYADIVALFGAAMVSLPLVAVDPVGFYNGLTAGLIGVVDVANGLVKAAVFGFAIALSSCHFGLTTSGGAPGVGRSVNATVVASATGIFLLDYLVSFALP